MSTDINKNSCGILNIDVDAICYNYIRLSEEVSNAECGACVKANCYGLGMEKIAPALAESGCNDFFVAFVAEGICLRQLLPKVNIHVFEGVSVTPPKLFFDYSLTPALNSLVEIESWVEFSKDRKGPALCDIHIDTGMLRLGLTSRDIAKLQQNSNLLKTVNCDILMSHLACADEKYNPKNNEQLKQFNELKQIFDYNRLSLANSSAIFLGKEYHFDLVRPGAALYGINPIPAETSPVLQVVNLKGKIQQIRSVDTPQTVGYGATHKIKKPSKLATVGIGYGDGYFRCENNTRTVFIDNNPVPIIGRVSMDSITIDVTTIPEQRVQPGMTVDLICQNHTVDNLAHENQTIGYEILTAMGNRYQRIYKQGNNLR